MEGDLRKKVVEAALFNTMGHDTNQDPNKDYFEKKDGDWVLKNGKVFDGLDDRIYNRSGDKRANFTGCRRATESILLGGLARLAKELGDDASKKLDDAVAGKPFNELFPKTSDSDFQKYFSDPKLSDLIPGDRVWMDNHKYVEGLDELGTEGSNVIYLGKDANGDPLFQGMDDGHNVRTDKQLQMALSQFSGDRGDKPNTYKFRDRYSPKVPPCLSP